MRLLRCGNDGEISLADNLASNEATPPYAILSHTWGADTEEVTFEDFKKGIGENKPGYEKIKFCGEQAKQDGLDYFWIDTCCINKADQIETQIAINSMFRWYQNATRCYVFLSDVSIAQRNEISGHSQLTWEIDFRSSRWFTRGWTLQELLAPRIVEFFSREWSKLGSKISLKQQIRDATGIPDEALSGTPLSQFSVNERLSWNEHRQTKLEEDRAYSLVGIFGAHISPFYGEGAGGAFRRLMDEVDKLSKCLQDLHLTNPRDDKKRIEDTKGGLLEGSYYWVLNNPNFLQWRSDPQSRLLWVIGDPGKGKTMLICGIINVLEKSKHDILSFFFCQGTDSRINNATAVLRGLIYLLVNQQPSLVSHLRKKYDQAGRNVFEDANAWTTLSDIFMNMIHDPDLKMGYLIVDALDECVTNLPKLLDLIIRTSTLSTRVKWLLSSRNVAHIQQKLRSVNAEARLSLELKQNAKQVSQAVDIYIDYKLSFIASLEDDSIRDQVKSVLHQKASGTFLWVALMVQELERPESWDPLQVVEEAPTGLYQLYNRMVDQIHRLTKRNSEICRLLISIAAVAYRPLYLAEIGSLCGLSGQTSVLEGNVRNLVAMCGSFLTVRDKQVYLIHQSAKDYLSDEMGGKVFRSPDQIHHDLFAQSLKLMFGALKRDMYDLTAPGVPISEVKEPVHDPLAKVRYSCLYWIDHLCCSVLRQGSSCNESLQAEKDIYQFLSQSFLYWLEALSLCKSMSKGVVSMAKLEALVQKREDSATLAEIVRDARRFIMNHKGGIENNPLQVYASALFFSPVYSLIRTHSKKEELAFITIRPAIRDRWSACLQTFEGHSSDVRSVAFSHDSLQLVSGSLDRYVKVWDAGTGECLQTLKGHTSGIYSVTFSHNSTQIASASWDRTIKIWETNSGKCLKTLKGHSDFVNSVAYSHDSAQLASASKDMTIKVWDVESGECLQTLQGHRNYVYWVVFSHDSTLLASSSWDMTVKIWDTSSGKCLKTRKLSTLIYSVAFSHDSALLASATGDRTADVWDIRSDKCLQTLKGHTSDIRSVNFSHNSTLLASGSSDTTIKIWNVSNGECLQTFQGHSDEVYAVAFSGDSARLASASLDGVVKVWDANSRESLQAFDGHGSKVYSMAFSYDLAYVASASWDSTVKIWDTSSGKCTQTLKGHSAPVYSVAFSHDSEKLASGSLDITIRVWDVSSGECLQTFKGHDNYIYSVVFSHDSTQVASASWDMTVKLWDTSCGMCLRTFKGHSSYVKSVAFSHDSTRLASGSSDTTIKLWNATSGECLQTLHGHNNGLSTLAFSHDSSLLASASWDLTVKIWDVSSGTCIKTLAVGVTLYSVSFGTSNSYIQTDIGTIDISARPGSRLGLKDVKPQGPYYTGIALSADKLWITYNSEKLIWLPSEHRPSCSLVSGETLCIGTGSGIVWTFTVELEAS